MPHQCQTTTTTSDIRNFLCEPTETQRQYIEEEDEDEDVDVASTHFSPPPNSTSRSTMQKIPLISRFLAYACKTPRAPLVFAQTSSSWCDAVHHYSVVPLVWKGLFADESINHPFHNPRDQEQLIAQLGITSHKVVEDKKMLWYLKKIFEAGIDDHLVLDPLPQKNGTLLHTAIRCGNAEAFDVIAEAAAKHPQAKTAFNIAIPDICETALVTAIRSSKIQFVAKLLDFSPQFVDVNLAAPDPSGADMTGMPLWKASEIGEFEIVKLLCDTGPRTGLDVDQRRKGVNSLFIAAQNGHAEIVDHLLNHLPNDAMKAKLDVNCQDTGLHMSCVYIASGKLRPKCLKLLLEDPRTDKSLLTFLRASPLQICSQETKDALPNVDDGLECLRLLIKHGFDVNAIHNNGYSPLAAAVAKNNIRAAKLLIQEGNANVKWSSVQFKSLGDLARATKNAEIIREVLPEQANFMDKVVNLFTFNKKK